MGECVFKRVLHPVGQGAFFTEHFFDSAGNAFFNVVYDCGEKSSTNHVDREIDNTLNLGGKPEVIDVMFISHLDEDHINGIGHLVNVGCLTAKSVVILPLHYPLVVKLILEQYRSNNAYNLYSEYDSLLSLFDSGAKILGIDDNTEPEVNTKDPVSLDEGLANIGEYSQIKSMQPLVYKDLWYYLPFNTILDDNRYKLFLQALAAAHIDRNQLADIRYVQKYLPDLIRIYQNLPKGIGGVTAINVNSLNVLSFSSKNVRFTDEEWLNYFGSGGWWYYPWERRLVYDCRCSCLYTGDCVMEAHFNKCLDALVNYITTSIGMLQIPHHGRQSCYDKAIACRGEIVSGFTNFNTTHKKNAFVKQIVHDFSVTGRMFFQITEHFHSRMELYVRLVV